MFKRKIVTAYLFTNRNTVVYDEKDEQVADIQTAISWERADEYHEYKEKNALSELIESGCRFYLAQWRGWCHQITADEFCSLLGHGPWYWEKYKQPQEDDTTDEDLSHA